MDRTAFLGRVRTALTGAEGPALPDSFPPTPASGPDDGLAQRFLAALTAVGGTGDRVDHDGVAQAVAAFAERIADDIADRTAVLAPDAEPFVDRVTDGLARAGFEPVRPADPAGWRSACAVATIGVTSARLGVASTGSVLIVSGADSPRAVSILPSAHLVVLPEPRLVPSFEDVMPVLDAVSGANSAPFLVTGPSRTSDIELVTVMGAHGPRALHVILVTEG
jgi:L-lactate dehydrogenase complex protein LldG